MRFTALLAALAFTAAQDPADSWLAYTVARGNGQLVTSVKATWVVPAYPTSRNSPSAPGWWFGIEPNPALYLIQPILAYGDGQNEYTIFNGEFDWPNGNWYQSESLSVVPGDVISASVTYNNASNSYNMIIQNNNHTQAVIKSIRPVIDGQTYTDVYFVTEHQPDNCKQYPASGQIVFTDIAIEWNYAPAVPQWSAQTYRPACNSLAHVISPSSVAFTWNAS